MLGRTPTELRDTIGSDDLTELMLFEELYGLPDGYFQTGQICALLANLLGGGGKKKRAIPADFIPYFASAKPAQTVATHQAIFQAMANRNEPDPKHLDRPFDR